MKRIHPPQEVQKMSRFRVRLKPGAKHDRILLQDGILSVSVTSPPVEGKANKHLVKLLAKRLSTAKSSISLISGERSKNKVIEIKGIDSAGVENRLEK